MIVPGTSRATFANILANDLANTYYQPLLEGIGTIVSGQLESRDLSALRQNAIDGWVRCLNVSRKYPPEVHAQISTEIIPRITSSASPRDLFFLLFFFVDELTRRKRFWCPTEPAVLGKLGFPYNSDWAVRGVSGVQGLRDWDVPYSNERLRGLRGNLEHQHVTDLTEDRIGGGSTYNPAGDWLVGIKSALFLGLPSHHEQPQSRAGQLCICSPVPGLFGSVDAWESSPNTTEFFRPYADLVQAVQDPKPRSFSSFFEVLSGYRQAGAQDIARNWIYQTVGLTHRNRNEAHWITNVPCQVFEHLLGAIASHSGVDEILQGMAATRGESLSVPALRLQLEWLRKIEESRLRFFQFLYRFGQRALGSPEPEPIAKESLKKLIDDQVLQISVVQDRPFPEVKYANLEVAATEIELQEKGALEYMLHQLLENAGKYGVRGKPITCTVDLTTDHRVVTISNEMLVLWRPASSVGNPCHDSNEYCVLKDKTYCPACLDHKLADFFDREQCWDPVANGGRFGLFMIRHFVKEFYGGFVQAHATRTGKTIEVLFRLGLPFAKVQS